MMLELELLEAAQRNDGKEVKRLIALGADPNARDVLNGGACLHPFSRHGDVEMVRFLLDHGAEPNAHTDNTGTSPLGCAALNGHTATVELLIARGGRLSRREVATKLIEEVSERLHHDVARLLEPLPWAENRG